MKKVCYLLLIFLLSGALPSAKGQTLGQVLRALQDRSRLIQERDGVTTETPIQWVGISGARPTDAAVNQLAVLDQLKLLKQAIKVSDALSGAFMESREFMPGGDLAMSRLKLEPINEEVSLATWSHILQRLAARISRMNTLSWKVAWPVESHSYTEYGDPPPETQPAAPVFLGGNESSTNDGGVISTTSSGVASITFSCEAGVRGEETNGEIVNHQYYKFEQFWSDFKQANTKGSAYFPGKFQVLVNCPYLVCNLTGFSAALAKPGSHQLASADWAVGDSAKFITLPSIFSSSMKAEGYWKPLQYDEDGFVTKISFIPTFTKQTSASLWETLYRSDILQYPVFDNVLLSGPALELPLCGIGYGSNAHGYRLTVNYYAVFRANFGAEFPPQCAQDATPPPAVRIQPDFANKSVFLQLSTGSGQDVRLVWKMPYSITLRSNDVANGNQIFGSLAARNNIAAIGDGAWDAVYSGDTGDRQTEMNWPGGPSTPKDRWPDFSCYMGDWWQPVLAQIVTPGYAANIVMEAENYRINIYRKDQVGAKDSSGRYVFPAQSEAVESFLVENSGSASDGSQMKISGRNGLMYQVAVTPTWDTNFYSLSSSAWTFAATKGGKTYESESTTVTEVTYTGGVATPYKVVTERAIDDRSVPKVTATYWDTWPNPNRTEKIIEEYGSETRQTSFVYQWATDALGFSYIDYLKSITQTGGVNPYTADYYNNTELITHYKPTDGGPEISWDYNGAVVTRTEKLGTSTISTAQTTYSKGMARAVTSMTGAVGAATAIQEYDPANAAKPWGLTLARDYDGTISTFTYSKTGDDLLIEEMAGRGTSGTAETVIAGTRTVTKVNPAGKTTSWEAFDIQGTGRFDFATASNFQAGAPLFPKTFSRPLTTTETFVYDDIGRVASHTDRQGKVTTYAARDPLGRLTQITENGLTWTYAYNFGHLGQKITCSDASARSWDETTTPFGGTHKLEISAPEHITTIRTETTTGVTTTETNDATHRSRTETVDKTNLSRTVSGNAVALTGVAGEQWTTLFAPNGSGGIWTTTNSASASVWKATTIDAVGHIRTEAGPSPTGSGSASTTYTYSNGLLATRVEPSPAGTTSFTYQPDGSLGSVTKGGRSVTIARTLSSATQIQWQCTNGEGKVLHLRTYYPVTGATDEIPYGNYTRKVTSTPSIASGNFTVSFAGTNLTGSQSWGPTGAPAAGSFTRDGLSESWTAQANGFGEVTGATEKPGAIGSGRTWSFTTTGLPVSATGLATMATTNFVTPYSTNGDLTITATQGGKTNTQSSSAAGVALEDTGYGKPDQTWSLPALGSTISRTLTTGAGSTTLQWLPTGQLQQRGFLTGAPETFAYNAAGGMTTWTPPGGSALSLNPDAFGQPRSIGTLVTGMVPDADGRLALVTDDAGQHSRTYTEGELDLETHRYGPLGTQSVDRDYDTRARLKKVSFTDNASYSYTYGSNGAPATITTAGGLTGTWSSYNSVTGRAQTFQIGPLTVTLTFNDAGQVTSQTNVTTTGGARNYSYGYDSQGKTNYLATPVGSMSLGLDGFGYVNSALGPNSSTASYTSDEAAQFTNVVWGGASGSITNTNGRPIQRINSSTVEVSGSVASGANVTIAANGGADVVTTPDGAGNFVKTYSPVAGWQSYLIRGTLPTGGYGGVAAIAEETRSVFVPSPTETVNYDTAGRVQSDDRWTYGYNVKGLLISATEKATSLAPGAAAVSMAFKRDWLGRCHEVRVTQAGALVTRTTFLYDGWKLIREVQYGPNGADELLRRTYTWGPDLTGTMDEAAGIGGLIEVDEQLFNKPMTKSLVISDGKGNITGLVDATTGTIVAKYDYGIFGEVIRVSGSRADACPLRWQSKYYYRDLKLYDFSQRMYNPGTRAWTTPDPLRRVDGTLYNYCLNQPLDYCDPIGAAPIPLGEADRRLVEGNNAAATAILQQYGGANAKIWTPDDILGDELKTSGFGLTNPGLSIPLYWTNIPIDDKARMRSQYPDIVDSDVALLEATRRNTVGAQMALASHGMLPEGQRQRLMLRAYTGMLDLTTIAATVPFQVPSAASMPFIGSSLSTPIADSSALLRPINPVGPMKGPVRFVPPANATEAEIAEMQVYVQGANGAWRVGELSPVGRVSTVGPLRAASSRAAALERSQMTYFGVAGHVPDTTWRGGPSPYMWLDQTQRINSSLGAQSLRYPIGFRPTGFTIGE